MHNSNLLVHASHCCCSFVPKLSPQYLQEQTYTRRSKELFFFKIVKLLQCATIITPKKYVLPKTNRTILFTFNNEIFLMITRNKEEHGKFYFFKATTMHYNNIIQKKYILPKPIKLSNVYQNLTNYPIYTNTHQTMQYVIYVWEHTKLTIMYMYKNSSNYLTCVRTS